MYIAIYGRVSTEKQLIDGFGLDVQLNELIIEVKESKQDYKEYIDEGISGTSIEKRLGLQSLLNDVSKGLIKEVWVTKLSRLGRNTRDVLNIIYEFERNNVVFKSKRDGIDTSNQMGKIMLQFMSIVSEMERDIIIETTRAGADYRASIGKIYGCPPILGYDRIGGGKNSYIIINENESKIIKHIYNSYLKGHGYKAIVNDLNARGFRTKKDKYFAVGTIKGILMNPIYAGMIRYNLYKDWEKKGRKGKQDDEDIILVDGIHQNIISKSKWNKVQNKMKELKGIRRPITNTYPLNTILKCPHCGASMTGTTRRYLTNSGKVESRYYICCRYHNQGKLACNVSSINADQIEKSIISYVSNILLDEKYADIEVKSVFKKIRSALYVEDKMIFKVFMKKFIKSIIVDKNTKQLLNIEFNINEELLFFLKEKYTEEKEKKLKKLLEPEMHDGILMD